MWWWGGCCFNNTKSFQRIPELAMLISFPYFALMGSQISIEAADDRKSGLAGFDGKSRDAIAARTGRPTGSPISIPPTYILFYFSFRGKSPIIFSVHQNGVY